MSNRSMLAAITAFLFVLFMACSSGGEMRKNANSNKKPPGAEASGEGESESTGEAAGTDPAGEGEATAGDDTVADLPYKADHSLYYVSSIKETFDTYCISCHPQQIPSLTTFESIRNNAEDIKASLMGRTMPPPGSKALPDAVRLNMVNWILAGTKKAPSSISFENPLRLNTPDIGGLVEFKLRISANTEFPSYRLFSSTTANATSGGNPIAGTKTLESSITIPWNSLNFATGTYFFYAELDDGPESAVATSTGSYRIGLPSIVLGSGWRGGSKAFLSTADLEYTIQNADSMKTYTVNVAVKKGAGAYQNIATGVADPTKVTLPGSYTFTDGIDYTFKVTLLENGEPVHFDESLAPVGIATAPVSYATLRTDFIDAKCGTCHAKAGQSGSYESDNYSTANAELAGHMVKRLSDTNARMPPPPNAELPADEKDLMKLWFWLGADP